MAKKGCLPPDVKSYIAQHLRDDAQHHISMTTEEYRVSHEVIWRVIDWETWVEVMEAQAEHSNISASLVESLPDCEEVRYGQ